MIYFNLKALEEKLAINKLSEKESFIFLLLNWVVFGFFSFIVVDKEHDAPGVIVLLSLIPTIGLFIAFFANQKGDGKDFLKRFISVHWVLGIRFFILNVALVALFSFVDTKIDNNHITGGIFPLAILAVMIIYYYSIGHSLRRISSLK